MTEGIKARVELVKKGKLPEGYVKTKTGIIPHQWDVKPLGMISKRIKEKAGDKKLETLSISAGIGFVNQAEKFGKELSGAQYVNYTVINKGDFSYNKGNSKIYPQGCIYMLVERETAAVPNVFNSFRIERQNAEYYKQLFIHGVLNHQLYRYINSGVRNDGLLNLYDSDFYSCELPVPSLSEQQKIAEILSTCDRLLSLQRRKIEDLKTLKKSCLCKMFPKQGSSVPEIRFPGFTDTWKICKIGELTNVLSARRVHKEEWAIKGVPFFRSSDVVSAYRGTTNEKVYISFELYEELAKSSGKLEKDDILITGGGSIGIPYIVPDNKPLYAKDADLIWIKKSALFNSQYLFAYLESREFRAYIKSISHIGTIAHYTIEQVKATPISLPTTEEQYHIGEYFTHLDNLITLHQRELEEMENYKKAMMQLLFTGIVRVN